MHAILTSFGSLDHPVGLRISKAASPHVAMLTSAADTFWSAPDGFNELVHYSARSRIALWLMIPSWSAVNLHLADRVTAGAVPP